MNKNNNMQIPSFLQKTANDTVNPQASCLDPESVERNCVERDCDILQVSRGTASNKNQCGSTTISQMEREALICSINGMSHEQLDVILDNIPIELVYNRLGRELERNKAFINTMKNAMSLIKTSEKERS